MNINTINELSTKELETLLISRKKQENAKREADKKVYVGQRDYIIDELFSEAKDLALSVSRFKQKMHSVMDIQKQKLEEYGAIRSNSKGGFSIFHSDGITQITRRRDTDPVWDERAHKAVELIKDFLSDTVKKRDAKLHSILLGFLERNAKGDLEYAKVMDLLNHEDKFEDARWLEGLRLIKESYSQSFKAFGYEFKQKDNYGKWKALALNFSSL
ncbi:DUF3164 family protein [Pedobacter sp.]|uniref:DUF3164 family protein n=1 Tax=Pedobacter sp. TaxID=1411316 RepID=UPI0031CF5D5E